MKGVVFSFKNHNSVKKGRRIKLNITEVQYFLRRYGVQSVFILLLFVGITIGSVYSQNCDKSFFNSLDFLFTTNFDVRLSQNLVETFSACFASDFIFLLTVYLLGLAPWGIAAMPFVIFFKGFGTGLTAGYLISAYSFKGAGFYLIILLPGTFLFCMALVLLSTSAFYISKQMFLFAVNKCNPKVILWQNVKRFCSRSMSILIMTFCSAVLDAVLWTLFAEGFNF